VRANSATPEARDKREGTGDRKRPGQKWGVIGQAESREGPRGVDVVIGMARGVQHHGGREPVRGVPAVGGADGFKLAILATCAGQTIVLDIVGQQDLALRMKGKAGPDEEAWQPSDGPGKRQGHEAAADIGEIGVQPKVTDLLAKRGLCLKALAEAAKPGAFRKTVEAFAFAGRVRVFAAGDMAVVNKPVGAGVLAEEEADINGSAKAEMVAARAMDQLMRAGMGNLPKPEAGRKEEKHAFAGGEARRTGNPPGCEGKKCERGKTGCDKKRVCGGKLGSFGLASGQRNKLVEDERQDAHVKECGPKPRAAKRHAEADQCDGGQGGKREGRQGQRTRGQGGGSGTAVIGT
jgi:hypothetical protein